MAPLRWRLGRWVGALGWQGLLGLSFAAAAATLYVTAIHPGMARMTQLQQEALSVRDFARTSANIANASAQTPEMWLEHFYRLLPARSSAPEWLRLVFSAARAQSLDLAIGAYKFKIEDSGRMVAYDVTLPVRGTYVQMRAFITDVLDRIPAAALEEFTVKREAIGDPMIDASIRFTLFMNGN